MSELILGSICLSDIPRELIKDVTLRNGEKKKYLNIKIKERKEPGKYGETHFISCEPKQEERKEGVNYIIGSGKKWEQQSNYPSQEDINNAPPIDEEDGELPF